MRTIGSIFIEAEPHVLKAGKAFIQCRCTGIAGPEKGVDYKRLNLW